MSEGHVVFVAQQSGGGGSAFSLLVIILIVVAMYFLLIRPQQRQRREMQQMQSRLATGNQVITVGGLHGTVVEADDETVTLEVAPGVTNRYVRGAIARIVEPRQDGASGSGGGATDGTA
jgi:preprotein translocase subunit YajC